MTRVMRNIRGAVGTGLGWAFAGAVVALFIFEGLVDPHGYYVDVWIAALVYPGFFGGVIFYTLLRFAEGRRTFAELSLRRVALWGALSGLLLIALFLIIATGLGEWKGDGPDPLLTAAIAGATTLSAALAACAWVAIGRWVKPGFELAMRDQ